MGGEVKGDGAADPACGAGDQGGFSFDLYHGAAI
jgi:hypothetical protein